ncbi:MAG: PEPxxWA-CTERM sorting domain-containing protein [Pseudomonadota bacterium]|uniref:PEPxxWA-CTERM sorting domain-containing protein n=1 Tax=Phenylobacterium sp. TaxID=1871053 RepID=UPI0025E43926|nr:PEPxxWA-CTERM sorting domain-containing protein [Phenylobacterium sp.]
MLACAGSASAAPVIDFEGYALGASTGAAALEGTPHSIARATGIVVSDPGGAGGKALRLTQDAGGDGRLYIQGGATGDTTEWGAAFIYLADLVSFDVWVPEDTYMNGSPGFARLSLAGGQWTTYMLPPHRTLDVGNVWYFHIANSPAYIDNLVFQNGRIAAVPEPATWAMMIAGFGLAGAALRQKRSVAA